MTGQITDYCDNFSERAGAAGPDVTARAEQDTRENEQKTHLSGIERGTGYAGRSFS